MRVNSKMLLRNLSLTVETIFVLYLFEKEMSGKALTMPDIFNIFYRLVYDIPIGIDEFYFSIIQFTNSCFDLVSIPYNNPHKFFRIQ
jgi:hypothetical protein